MNDEPVTRFEVEQLTQFLALSVNIGDCARGRMKAVAENPATNDRLKAILQETIQANAGKSRDQVIAAFEERKKQFVISMQKQAVDGCRANSLPGLRKTALDELIEERLKFQEAKRLTVVVTDDDVEKQFKGLADRNKMTPQEFANHIRGQGVDPAVMKARFKAQIVWREVIRKRFGHTITISNKDVERLVQTSKGGGEELTELQLQRITLATTGAIDQRALAQRLEEAERMRGKFAGCKATAALAKDATGAKFEDLGYRKASSIEEPIRSMLVNAKDGEMAPASLTAQGAELYAVCGRRVAKLDDQKRQAVESELQMKEFERIARRHLQDLRKDALIEIK